MTRIYLIDFLCERWIPFQASTSVLCLHYRPETVNCSTKDVYASEKTFLPLQSLVRSRDFRLFLKLLENKIWQQVNLLC